MRRVLRKITLLGAALPLLTLLFVSWSVSKKRPKQPFVSRFGTSQDDPPKAYDGTLRHSDYLALSDGTRLAYDLILPTKHGVSADQPLPILFKYTPYLRTWTMYDKNGKSNIACADADNFDTPVLNPAPRLQVLRNTSHPSYIDLPIAQAGEERMEQIVDRKRTRSVTILAILLLIVAPLELISGGVISNPVNHCIFVR